MERSALHLAIMTVLAAAALLVAGVLTDAEPTAAVNPVPCPTLVPVATATPDGGPTYTFTPTHTPCLIKLTSTPTPAAPATATDTPTPTSIRPPANPQIDVTVNGVDGPISVTEGASVTYRWVVTNLGERPMHAAIDDDTHDALDGECAFVNAGATCEQTVVVPLLTPGTVTNTSVVSAVGIPPYPDIGAKVTDSDSATVDVKSLEPPVGGVALFPELAVLPLEAADSSGSSLGMLFAIAASVVGSIVALGGVWYARRRLR